MTELILNFHGVGEAPPGCARSELKFWWDKAPFLAALDEISKAAQTSTCSIVLTFDDGNASDVGTALPALLERNLKATFFVCAGRIGRQHYLDAPALRDLLEAGMSVGSHGMHHVDWRRAGDAELDVEISGARRALENICGRPINEAGIPFGSYDRRVLRRLRVEGWRCVYTSDGGYARSNDWIKARNTVDSHLQREDVVAELKRRDTLIGRLKCGTAKFYKQLR